MEHYDRYHRNFLNLVIHVATVPLFVLAVACMAFAPFAAHWELWWGAGVAVAVYCVLLQRFGHRFELYRLPPAGGPLAAMRRVLAEHFVEFPRFVLSGAYLRCWRIGAREFEAQRKRRPGRGEGRS